MKKFSFIPVALLILLSLTITSCKKEKPLNEAIIGKWEVFERTVVMYQNDIKKESHTEFLGTGEMVYQFVEGGSGIYYEGTNDYLFSWVLNGVTVTISHLYVNDLVTDVNIDGATLVFSYKETDTTDPTTKYEYFLTAKKI
jgi:hypothetical protein